MDSVGTPKFNTAVIEKLQADVKTLKAKLAAYRWIPVGERLPMRPPHPLAYTTAVMTLSKTWRVRVDKYVHKKSKWLSGRKDQTHWQFITLPDTE